MSARLTSLSLAFFVLVPTAASAQPGPSDGEVPPNVREATTNQSDVDEPSSSPTSTVADATAADAANSPAPNATDTTGVVEGDPSAPNVASDSNAVGMASSAPHVTAPVRLNAANAPATKAAPLADVAADPAADAEASTPPSLTVTGSFFSRYERRKHYARLGVSQGRFLEGDAVAYRARFGLMTAPKDIGGGRTVLLAFTPQASGFYATAANTLTDAELALHEGYLRLEAPCLGLDVGRFVMNYGDSLVIGSVDWHQTGRSFEGARTHVPLAANSAYLDVFATQVAEGRGAGDGSPGAGDGYFAGAYLGVGPFFSQAMAIDVYALANVWPRTTGVLVDPQDPAAGTGAHDTAVQGTFGLRVKNQVGVLDYRMETGLQMGTRPRLGSNPSVLAGHGDLEIGVTPVAPFTVSAEALYASGDNPDTTDAEGWDQLYPTAHKFLGLADIFGGRSNIYGAVLSASVKAMTSLTFKAQGHRYWRPRHPGRGSYAGSEIDAHAIYAIGEGLKLRAMYALFLPSDDQYADDVPARFFELELRYDL